MGRKPTENPNWETVEHKTAMCPLLSEGTEWKKLATALPLSTLLKYEDIVSRWCRFGDENKPYPICEWLRGRRSTDSIIELSKK